MYKSLLKTAGAVKKKNSTRLIEPLWNDTDPRAFGPKGLCYIMTKHDIGFGLF
jgi:hypothetical protein